MTAFAYYNEMDPYAAQWLRNLIAAGHIAPGEVDERSIEDVAPNELGEFTQCHFFAGIGVWSHALRLAGWEDSRPVWTGSCPCQPFSVAGMGSGFNDQRHLWPMWFHLIEQRRPAVVFGEQVEAAIRHNWLDLVQADLEGIGYAFAPVGIPAAGVGAPHIRQRLFFVADSIDTGLQGWVRGGSYEERQDQHGYPGRNRTISRMADNHENGREPGEQVRPICQEHDAEYGGATSIEWAGKTNGFWRDADWLLCKDGKWRPVESGTFPLVDGASARVGRLRAYGNAIVPQVAAEVIRSYMEHRP